MGLLLNKLKKTYVGPDGSSVPVIDVPQLYIADAEQIAMIGTSGSGKTTLLHMIAGILTPDTGNIVFGFDPTRQKDGSSLPAIPPAIPAPGSAPATDNSQSGTPVLGYKRPGESIVAQPEPDQAEIDVTLLSEPQRDEFRGRNIGYIFQTHHLLPGFTALENVLLGMTFTGRRPDPQWAAHLLNEVGLSDRKDYKPQKLSVGQQQRVAVARALANRPRLVLADEPTGALDSANAQQVLDLIRKLCAEVSASLLLVSHDLDIARQLPRVLTLSEINLASTAAKPKPTGPVQLEYTNKQN
jgi:putative ABC transport system ATP-binding protein